jgi:hypothetical protein
VSLIEAYAIDQPFPAWSLPFGTWGGSSFF